MHHIEHHLAHLYSAFYVSPFTEAVIVSVDGFGDFSSAAWGAGKGADLSVDGRVFFPHSLGLFYQALTQYLGFPHYGDEYKVMGLAPYGKPTFVDAMRKIVRLGAGDGYELDLTYFRHHKERIAFQWTNGTPEFADLFAPALEALLGPRRRDRRAARAAPSRYRALGPGNVRGGVFPSDQPAASALWTYRPDARRRLRHEFRSQWQGAEDDAISPCLHPIRCRRCWRRDWSRIRCLAQFRGCSIVCDGSCLLGASIWNGRDPSPDLRPAIRT